MKSAMYGCEGAATTVAGYKELTVGGPFQGRTSTGKAASFKSRRDNIARRQRRPLSIVEIVVTAPRRHAGRTLQELRRVRTRFARSRALGRIAADFGL